MAVIAAAYLTLIALTPRTDMMMMQEISWAQLLPLSVLYLLLGISGFDYARRRSSVPISLAYLLIEFAIGMGINGLAWQGSLPLILLPLAAQAVVLLPRVLAPGCACSSSPASAAACRGCRHGRTGCATSPRRRPPWCSWSSTSVSRSVNVKRGSAPKRWPPKSRSSRPRTSATAWRARFTTRWGTT